jgi:DNA-binding protein HU-beta
MNKADLIARVSEQAGVSRKDAEKVVNAMLSTVEDTLRTEGRIAVSGFGTFELRERAARQGRNPATGAALTIGARKAIVFRPGKALKDAVQAE